MRISSSTARHRGRGSLGLNPGFEWQINKTLKLDGQANWTKSSFHRESPTVLPITPGSSGVTVNYNGASSTPSITTNIDLNNPANFIWAGGRVNQQEAFRDTETKRARANLTGATRPSTKTGLAFDDIRAGSARRTTRAPAGRLRNNPSLFLLGPNGAPACDGANTPGTSMAALYPGFGTGYTAGQTNPLTNRGSLIPLTALPSYLSPGPGGFVTIDWNRFSQDSHYGDFVATAPDVGSSNTGASAGYIREKDDRLLCRGQWRGDHPGLPLRYNAGLRYVKMAEQTVGGFISIPTPQRRAEPAERRQIRTSTRTERRVDRQRAALGQPGVEPGTGRGVPRLGLALDDARRPERAAPGHQLQLALGRRRHGRQRDAQAVPVEQPRLRNRVVHGRLGLHGGDTLRQEDQGVHDAAERGRPFLAAYGVTYDSLSPTQQAAINARGGPGTATVVLQRDTNADGYLKIKGLELSWVQPLDRFLWGVRGFGFSTNFTRILQSTTGGVSGAVALGVPKTTYNLVGYYENHGFMIRLSQTYRRKRSPPRTRTGSRRRRSVWTTTSRWTCRRASTWAMCWARPAISGPR
jgi:hypothetical protein